MAYSTAVVTGYCGTGFSMINTPATPAVLAGAATATVNLGTINVLSLIGKRSGSIRVHDFNGIATLDYVKIVFSGNPIDTYWVVTGYEYLSSDTLEIAIILDGFLTCGGTTGITGLSGYVKRHTVTDDTYGKYNQADPLLVPSQNLIIRTLDTLNKKQSGTMQFYNIVLSTVNLWDLGKASATDLGITYGDTSQGSDVNIPYLPPMRAGWLTQVFLDSTHEYVIPNAVCFDGDDSTVKEGINRCQQLGIIDCILACYAIPKNAFTISYWASSDSAKAIASIEPNANFAQSFQTSIYFNYANVSNKRCLYGEYNTVQMCSMSSGEMVEYDIDDLYSTNYGNNPISILFIGDPRAHGTPIYYPLYYRGRQQTADALISCIRGMEWQNVPLKFTYASREGIDRIRFFEGKSIDAKNILDKRQVEDFFYPQNSTWNATTQMAGGNIAGGFLSGIKAGTIDYNQILANRQVEDNAWFRARDKELKDFLVDTRIIAPEIHFPPSESIRDFIGNGVVVALVTPTDTDIARMDKILNAYGYMDSGTTLTTADLTAGLNFSYIEATGVQLTTSIAVDRNIIEQAQVQIESGIRIWKHKPNFAEYTTTNRS